MPSFRSQQDIGRHQPPVCLQVGRVCLCSFMFLEALLSHPNPKAPTPSQTHSMVHLRLKESHSPGQFHTLSCRCSGHPPKGWGSCRWGRCPHGSSGWVAMLSLEGVPPGAAATAAPSGTRTDDTLGPSWCSLQWPQGFPVMTPRAEAHQGPSSPGAGTPALFTPASLLAEAACWLRLLAGFGCCGRFHQVQPAGL